MNPITLGHGKIEGCGCRSKGRRKSKDKEQVREESCRIWVEHWTSRFFLVCSRAKRPSFCASCPVSVRLLCWLSPILSFRLPQFLRFGYCDALWKMIRRQQIPELKTNNNNYNSNNNNTNKWKKSSAMKNDAISNCCAVPDSFRYEGHKRPYEVHEGEVGTGKKTHNQVLSIGQGRQHFCPLSELIPSTYRKLL